MDANYRGFGRETLQERQQLWYQNACGTGPFPEKGRGCWGQPWRACDTLFRVLTCLGRVRKVQNRPPKLKLKRASGACGSVAVKLHLCVASAEINYRICQDAAIFHIQLPHSAEVHGSAGVGASQDKVTLIKVSLLPAFPSI